MSKSDKLSDNKNILGKIKTLPAMASIDEKDLQELLRISKIVRYGAEERIVDESTNDGWIYYLISGRVRIVKKGTELAVLHRIGDVFGDVGKLGGGDLSVSVHALEDTVCLKIAISSVDGLPHDNRFVFRYAIFRGFAEVMAKRLRITTAKYNAALEEIERLKDRLESGS